MEPGSQQRSEFVSNMATSDCSLICCCWLPGSMRCSDALLLLQYGRRSTVRTIGAKRSSMNIWIFEIDQKIWNRGWTNVGFDTVEHSFNRKLVWEYLLVPSSYKMKNSLSFVKVVPVPSWACPLSVSSRLRRLWNIPSTRWVPNSYVIPTLIIHNGKLPVIHQSVSTSY
jgi:hypothetical protein